MTNMATWAQGPDLTALTITGLTYDNAGVETAGSSVNIQALVRRLRHNITRTFEDWRPLTSLQIHNILTGAGNGMELAELIQVTVKPKLADLVAGFTHVLVAYTKGAETYTGRFRIGDWEGNVEGPSGMENNVQLLPYNPGVAQVVRT